MLMGTVQKHILRKYFSCSQLIAMPVTGSVCSEHRFESICRFLHFIDNSYQDTYEELQKLFKMCPIIRHLNSKATRHTNHSHCGRTAYPSTCTCHSNCHSSERKEKKTSNYEWSSGYLWSSTVYTGKKTIFESPLISKKHTKNSSTSSESFWTHTPQWQLTCGWINIKILQAWLGLKSCNTNCVVMVKINSKVRKQVPDWQGDAENELLCLEVAWHLNLEYRQ